jgi:hypothetical protein
MRVTPLEVFYGACAAPGAVVPWYFNIRYMAEAGEVLTPGRWLAAGFATSLAGSAMSDLLIGATPAVVWMFVEARRLGMRHWWVFALGVLVAFAFVCPLFLILRERHLRRARTSIR